MIKQRTLFAFALIALSCCTANKQSELSNSQVKNDTTVTSSSYATTNEEANKTAAVPDSTLHEIDTLFNTLAKLNVVHGNFVSVTSITENFLDANDPSSSRQLLAYLIQSGEGQYGGMHEGVPFETVYSVLAIFEDREGDLNYITHLELAASSSGGLVVSTTEGEEIKLTDGKYGVMIHNKSSEEGAGDSGFRRDEGELYVLVNGKPEKVFQTTLDDFSFASNETDSYGEQTTTVALSVLDSKTNGLFDIQTVKSTTGNSWTEEEETPSEESEESDESSEETEETEESEPAEEEVDDGVDLYKWNGTSYEISEDN
jgi:hypothetical protein